MALSRQMSKKVKDSIMGTGTSTMTLSTWEKKAKKYQTLIIFFIIIIAIISFVQLLFGIFLVKVYYITILDFASHWFTTAPFAFMGLGVSAILICIYGLIVCRYEKRPLVLILALLFSVAFLAELFALYSVTKIDSIVVHDEIEDSSIWKFMEYYTKDEIIGQKWDNMQIGLRCCGADGKEMINGYSKWTSYLQFPPDSCCHKPDTEKCASQKRSELKKDIQEIIPCGCNTRDSDAREMYRTGCIGLMLEMLKKDIFSFTNIYLAIGVLLSILELIVVMLCFTYSARLSRRKKINNMLS